ncbi:MAG: glutathione S-transferase family protein [Nannocystis sp.]|nr:glutathione S-transferase family protein [Nannocystis sp.]
MPTSYELVYFPVRGRAEPIRLLFAAADVPFTDTAVTDWPALKPKTPLGKVPILIERGDDGEQVIPESMTILRHLARTFSLDGADERARVVADYTVEALNEWRSRFTPVLFASFARTEQSVIDKYWSDLPATLALFERLLAQAGGAYFAGGALSYADLLAFDTLDGHLNLKPDALADAPGLHAFVARLREHPGLAAYLATRR